MAMKSTKDSRVRSTSAYQNVLLVDDDANSLALTQLTLEHLGVASVTTADDGTSAIRSFDRAQPKPDLVVCDLYMPDMDDIELLNELGRRNYAGGIIMVTGGDLGLLEMACEVAVSGHGLKLLGAFAKPVPASDLAHLLGAAPPAK
jgi:CheY-like chemotaxis protein